VVVRNGALDAGRNVRVAHAPCRDVDVLRFLRVIVVRVAKARRRSGFLASAAWRGDAVPPGMWRSWLQRSLTFAEAVL